MEINIKTNKKEEATDITEQIQEAVNKLEEEDRRRVCNKKNRACLIYCPHTTAALLVNEGYDFDVVNDILSALGSIVPKLKYKHSEGNSISHIKSSLIGCSVTIPLLERKLNLGRWQRIFFLEFDGPRERKIILETVG